MRARALKIFFALFLGLLAFLPFSHAQEAKEIQGFVRVQDVNPDIVVELRYATENNFTGKKIYPVAVCLLRKETAQKLAAANKEFMKKGFRLKIWDGYRPPYVQKIFWNLLPDDRYVANPNKGGSKHNRGGAVDITLVDKNGNELEMPSLYDDFSERASPVNPKMSKKARKNVNYLRAVMMKHGFVPIADEWWHFDDADWEKFPLVDVVLEDFLEGAAAEEQTSSDEAGIFEILNEDVKQLLIVYEKNPASIEATLSTWEKTEDGWHIVLESLDAVLGKKSLVLAVDKKEGDGHTPAGLFSLGTAFGYEPQIETGLSYRQATDNDFWIDDSESAQYNQWVVGAPQAKSYEKLKREDDLYKYAAVIEYNTAPVVPGKGSAIFLHIWRASNQPTSGCIALSEENIKKLLSWLDKEKNPAIFITGRF